MSAIGKNRVQISAEATVCKINVVLGMKGAIYVLNNRINSYIKARKHDFQCSLPEM